MILVYSTPPLVHFHTKNQIIHVRPRDKPFVSFYFFPFRLISYDVLREQTKFCQSSNILRRHNIALHLLNKILYCFSLGKYDCLVIFFGRT
jgi:hypothetical protein